MRLALALFAVLLLAGCIAVDSTREVVTAPAPADTADPQLARCGGEGDGARVEGTAERDC